MTWLASSLIGNWVPSSDWNESMGARVPEVRMTDRAEFLMSEKTRAEFRHQKWRVYLTLIGGILVLYQRLLWPWKSRQKGNEINSCAKHSWFVLPHFLPQVPHIVTFLFLYAMINLGHMKKSIQRQNRVDWKRLKETPTPIKTGNGWEN